MGLRVLVVLIFLILNANTAYAGWVDNPVMHLSEQDDSPSSFYWKLYTPNASLTEHPNGEVSLDFTTSLDSVYFKLDQSTPQTVSGTATLPTINIGSSTGVSATAAAGILTLAGIGGTNNESMTLNFETTDNIIISPIGSAEVCFKKSAASTGVLSVETSSTSAYTNTTGLFRIEAGRPTSGTVAKISDNGGLSVSSAELSSGSILQLRAGNTVTATSYSMAGNVLNIDRDIDYNKADNTMTVTGAVVDILDNMVQTAGTLTHTAPVVNIGQNYTSSTGAVLQVTGLGTGNLFKLIDNATTVFSVADGGAVTSTGTTIYTPSDAQAITGVGSTILANATMVIINPDGNYTLTSAPTIADGTIGQILYITSGNTEANTVTVQDQDALPNSNLQLGAARTIGARDVLTLMFDGTDWIEQNYADN